MVNPYRYGIIASTDSHTGAPGAVSEAEFVGHGGAGASSDSGLADSPWFNPGGLAGVWAEENTRESIFAALERKETWGTSGPRIRLRFFASETDLELPCGSGEWLTAAYAEGVMMGSVLQTSSSPTFHVLVEADPTSQPIEQVQLVKGWLGSEGHEVALYDAVMDPNGKDGFCLSWSDPDFLPDTSVFYYVRVFERATDRWSRAACETETCPEAIPTEIRERAWSSPIWVQP